MGVGASARYELSHKFMRGILEEGKELAEVVDELSGQVDVRSNQGAMGTPRIGLRTNKPIKYSSQNA